ncbi:organic cation transporter protein-like [Amphiura filiformis]|uniref:organic cation transporter protein-like n=1 Tax=Amphiura filiformis TaxID=82378 RepID=UPI003B213862
MKRQNLLPSVNASTEAEPTSDLDGVLRQLGNFGRYQTLQFALLCLYGCWFTAWQLMGIIFTASTPQNYHCTSPPGFSANETVPRQEPDSDGVAELERCKMFVVHDGIVTKNVTDCEYGWDYQMAQKDETTIVTDFDLICDYDLSGETVQSVLFGGVLVGAIISGQLSDIVGRKIIIHASLVGEAGVSLTVFVMYMEMFTPEMRGIAGGIGNIMWGIGVTLITPIAYLLPNWRHLQMTISLVCLIGIPFYWFIQESIRWLISRGRLEEAEQILQKIAKFNHISAPRKFLTSSKYVTEKMAQLEAPEEPCLTVETRDFADDDHGSLGETHVSRDTSDAKPEETKIVDFVEENDGINGHSDSAPTSQKFVNSVVYYGLSLNSVNLAGNKYLNIFLLCVVEIPCSIFVIIALKWCPRRWCQSISFLIAGVFCILTGCIPDKTDNGTDLGPLIVTAATLGKFSISFSFCLVFVYTSEWLPTIVRNAGVGGTSLCARAGGMVAPFLVYLSGVDRSLPLIIFGVISIIASGLTLFFPETLNRTMPTTITDAEKIARESSLCKIRLVL